MMAFLMVVATTTALILIISVSPCTVFVRKLSFRATLTDSLFWASTLATSIAVAVLVSLSG